MKQFILFLVATSLLLGTSIATAGGETEKIVEERIVVELITDDFTIDETDLSHLAVGDAETRVTESGKTVDLLRTEDGIEIYVDGELIDVGGMHDEKHIVHEIKIICDEDTEDCDDLDVMASIEDIEIEGMHSGDHKFIVVSDGEGDWDVEMLPEGAHEAHGTVHIVKEIHGEDLGDLHEAHELREASEHDIIIIKKKTEDEI